MRIFLLTILLFLSSGFRNFEVHKEQKAYRFPFKEAGLTKEQAAAHLLNRFTFGATPGLVKEVAASGLEKWFAAQLLAADPDGELLQHLAPFDALQMTNAEIVANFPKPGQLRELAIRDSVVRRDTDAEKKEYQALVQKYMQERAIRPEKALIGQVTAQKIMRAVYSKNQLQEVMTSFWFNHFNVSFDKKHCIQFILSYERDVIRPNALGKFSDLLLATAKSPAMLTYLDNFNSTATSKPSAKGAGKPTAGKKRAGLNENYAREVMELHTLGVDGGYTQNDVTEAARVLTGWSIYPLGRIAPATGNKQNQKLNNTSPAELQRPGIADAEDFRFLPNRHDQEAKTIMGKHFPPQGGYEEGVELLHMLAHHPSTAQFIAKKIATRFVRDNPPDALVQRMAKTFKDEDGDIRKVLVTMVSSPEFWSEDAVREKTKSPVEVITSSIRVLDATITNAQPLIGWCTRMGERIYFYQAPTGFPDRATYWISTGSLLTRMNFALAIAANKIPGVQYDALQLNENHEPESASEALEIYCDVLIPQRDHGETIKRLSPLLNEPDLDKKVKQAAERQDTTGSKAEDEMISTEVTESSAAREYNLHQVIGIILGSPEFQRR
ncbi:MAG TPA: DUF1800 domain-containing protein [Chryseolinea sp.]